MAHAGRHRRRDCARLSPARLRPRRCSLCSVAAARLAEGREVCYRCAETNTASMALAASLGFVLAAREYCPGFRRI
ncbi:MAG: hypothetical protein IJX53_01055 [Clostridia bacterium]|nr:hypothetical protein [Clostridia bacterium]